MCMQFVPGQQKALRSATAAEIERLGSVVAWAHGRPVDDLVDGSSEPGNLVSFAEGRLQSIISTLVWAQDPLPAAVQARLRSTANFVERSWKKARDDQSFSTGATLALLHGDPGPGNVPRPHRVGAPYSAIGRLGRAAPSLSDMAGLIPLGPAPRPSSCSRLGRKADPCTRSPLESRPSKASFARPEVAGARTRTFEDVPVHAGNAFAPRAWLPVDPKEPHRPCQPRPNPPDFGSRGSRASFRQSSSG